MTVMKISLLAAVVLWCNNTCASEPGATRVEQRFALHVAGKAECSASLRWNESCQAQKAQTPRSTLIPTTGILPDALMRQAFPESNPALLTRFAQE